MTGARALTLKSYTARFALPLWRWYLFGSVMLAAVNFINLEVPQLAKRIVNGLVAPSAAPGEVAGYRETALLIVALGLLIILIRGLSRIGIFWPGRRLESDTKSFYFAHVLRLPERFFGEHGMGDLISRLANDVGQLRAFYAFGLLQVLNVAFLSVMTIAQMVAVHARLTALALGPLFLMVLLTRLSMPRMHRASKANQEALGALTNRVTEAFVNVHVIQANAAEASFLERAKAPNEDVYKSNMQLVFVRTLVFPLMNCLAGLSQLAVLAYGGYEVVHQRLTVGDILSFNVYIGLLTFPLTALGIILALYQRAKTAVERLGQLEVEAPEGPRAAAVAATPAVAQSLLAMRGVHFSYPRAVVAAARAASPAPRGATPGASGSLAAAALPETGSPFQLGPLDLQLAEGGRLGLFGPIGCGKSTIMHLVTRLYDPPAGTVFWQGKDVLTLHPHELRKEIAYALQTVHLFSDTIRANLTFGLAEDTPLERLELACAQAQILDEIRGFPQGWDTPIGEKGLRLSGGQKQRLALARLFLRDARLYLLDDVLSAVDHATERKLVDELERPGRALIIASHRGSALRRCDEILVLDKGKVVDRGRFDELLRRHPALGRDV